MWEFIRFKSDRFLLETREKKKWTKKLNETSIVEEIISSLMRSIENRGRLGTGIIEDETTREVEACLPLHIYIYIRRSYYTEIAEVNNGEIKDSVAEREKRVPARNMLHFDFPPRRVYAISVGEL